MTSFWNGVLRSAGRALGRAAVDYAEDRLDDNRSRNRRNGRRRSRPTGGGTVLAPGAQQARVYDVTRRGLPPFSYTPHPDDLPDPGEVVWTWVPYEENNGQGKDRPVLVLARNGSNAIVAQLTSKDHDRDAAQEAHWGRHWIDIGAGDWDRQRRPSEVRVDRLLEVPLPAVRRTGGTLARARYDEVIAELKKFHR